MVGFTGRGEAAVIPAARQFSDLLGQEAAKYPQLPLRVLGPAPCNVVMVNDKYRYKLTIKCRNDKPFRSLLRTVIEQYGAGGWPAKAKVTVDMNSDGDR